MDGDTKLFWTYLTTLKQDCTWYVTWPDLIAWITPSWPFWDVVLWCHQWPLNYDSVCKTRKSYFVWILCELIPLKKHQAALSLISSSGPVPVTYSQFNGKLKQLIQACGLNPDDYSTHSFRWGGASCAFCAKVPDPLIQLQGDWASDCYKRYLEMGLMEKRDVSMKLIKHIKKQSVWVLSVIAPQGFQNVSRPNWFSNLWLIAASQGWGQIRICICICI